MTLTIQAPPRNPRELVSPDLFDRLVERLRNEYVYVARFYAEAMVEQMMCFLATAAEYDPADPPEGIVQDEAEFNHLTPSKEIDDALHAFLDLTEDYREFCEKLTGGRFIDHQPVTNSSITGGRSVAITVRAMRHYGWPLDDHFWGTGTSCCTDVCQGRVTKR
ncbi:hypothetical protein [Actinomadura terrae]|uniref:hypothetical protein n=1 Tax=Actinomadura terrae TaxID=604353 RepID=UPI001FA73C32|nr:hypothetical protein [Actinomadura terrae]